MKNKLFSVLFLMVAVIFPLQGNAASDKHVLKVADGIYKFGSS